MRSRMGLCATGTLNIFLLLGTNTDTFLQRLDEEDGPSGSSVRKNGPADLGAIVIQARRAREGASVMSGAYFQVQDSGAISEKTKKGILGAVTA